MKREEGGEDDRAGIERAVLIAQVPFSPSHQGNGSLK